MYFGQAYTLPFYAASINLYKEIKSLLYLSVCSSVSGFSDVYIFS